MTINERETRITWLNWKEMFLAADQRRDENFFMLSAILAERIESLCGEGNLVEWAGEDLCEDIAFDPTVMYHVRNSQWPWETMMQDLAAISSDFPEIILQITLIERVSSGKICLHNGRLTTVLYDSDSGTLTTAF